MKIVVNFICILHQMLKGMSNSFFDVNSSEAASSDFVSIKHDKILHPVPKLLLMMVLLATLNKIKHGASGLKQNQFYFTNIFI